MTVPCAVCGNVDGNRRHEAREMMYGRRETFAYLECGDCGCLQLPEPPADLAPYYPPDYYSYAAPRSERLAGLKTWVRRRLARARLQGDSRLGSLFLRRFGAPPRLDWLAFMGLGPHARILDVGCGAGDLLRELRRDGLRDLQGVDPFIAEDLDLGGGLRIHRRELADMDGDFDLVMLHHALEHMPDQAAVFAELRRLVRPGGWLLIRVPVADCAAWREYGVDWVQLDAPRHLFLHTRRSLHRLAEGAGFVSRAVRHDSTGFQFWGSEQYRRDVPLRDPRSIASGGAPSLFAPEDLAAYDRRAAELNEQGEGDQAAFFYQADDS